MPPRARGRHPAGGSERRGRIARVPGAALLVRGLVKRYGELTAVDGIDLEVRRGRCLGLLGPNGAGKTTTIEVLEGLLRPDAGRIELLGRTWEEAGADLRRRLGVQLQETSLPEKLTVRETVRLFASFYPEPLEIDRAIELVSLQEKSAVQVRRLSGGQRRRLSLACALVGRPELLFLDEPTTGLDPQARLAMWDVVSRFREAGGTVLLTTHDMQEAERLCDRVAIMDRGRIIAHGTPRELVASLGAEHVLELATEHPLPPEKLAGAPGVSSVTAVEGGLRLTLREPHNSLPSILAALHRSGARLTRLAMHHATLEDVFVALTGRHLREG
ncbi:MAG: ABC transporter ATP-binding protein [Acidobacteria bacterium]|nr:MAG: ABC transporter ATP-binding protein [Acidobacteriota bacterium]